ncbi:MAG TPA: hypothetical protein VEU31_02515 [Candidatus Acidoferrales bacterium]|nr:hypothetical protein [Candidatus Acidoferrales bacterium]
MRALILVLAALFTAPAASAAGESYLYRAELLQAAPGKLLELIPALQTRASLLEAAGDAAPFWMRHSQGDHWDLMLLYPMSSYAEFYSAERVAKHKKAESGAPEIAGRIKADIAWQEDVFVYGPPLEAVKAAFANARFFHIEMFVALAGHRGDLYHEREMENAYSKALSQPENLIFVRDQGAAWDLFTIGFYRDLKHYAESADVAPSRQEAAAKAAGFDSPAQIGPYLRKFISSHHDTLAVAVPAAAPK